MTHRRRRMSRLLLAVLALTIAVGLFITARKLTSGGGADSDGKVVAATQPGATQPSSTQQAAPEIASAGAATQPTPAARDSKPEKLAALVTETPSVPTVAGAGTGASANTPLTINDASPAAAAPLASPPKVEVQPQVGNGGAAPAAGRVSGSGSGSGLSNSSTPVAVPAAGAVADGRAKMQAGKLLEARDVVNGALASGQLSPQDQAAARQLLAEISQAVVFSPRRFADDKWGGSYNVQSGDRLDRIGAKYGLTPALLMRLNNISDARRLRAGATIKVLRGPFHAVVSKGNFRLDLYLGAPGGPDSVYVTSYGVGLGKDDSTPKGRWLVEPQKKIKNPVYFSPRGEGIIDADDPKNPLGEYWIGLVGTDGDAVGKQSYGIHGTIEPDSIGKQESMGCVRLKNEDVAMVFDALTEGKSTVVITD